MKKQNGVLTDVTIEDLEILKNEPDKFWKGVTTIGFLAFSKFIRDEIEEIEIPDSVKEIKECAFYMCNKLKNVKLPKDLKTIENSTFFGCLSIESIDLPDNVETISDFAFYSNGLKKINLTHNSKLKTIKSCAFAGNYDLTELYLPYNISNIEKDAFASCLDIYKIEFSNKIPNIELGAFEHKQVSMRIQDRNRKLYPNTLSVMFKDGSLKEKFKEENFYQVEEILGLLLNTIKTESLKRYVNFCSKLGAFEPSNVILNENNRNIKAYFRAYDFLKEVKQKNRLDYRYIPFDDKFENECEYDEEFLNYVLNDENWKDLEKDKDFFIKLSNRYEQYLKDKEENKIAEENLTI